jgi:hypothetical protein
MKGWVKIYATRDYTGANIVKGMLEENNLQVVILNNLDSSYLNFGDIELYVREQFKDTAKELLNSDSPK